MKTSHKGKIALAVSEGIVIKPYLDSVGVWTVGIGHTAAAGPPDPKKRVGQEFTLSEAWALYEKDIQQYENAVNRYINVPLKQQEFDSLVHFTYNIGPGGLARSNLRKWLNAGDKNSAFLKGFHGWLKPSSLLSRRNKERDIAVKGRYGSTIAPIYTVNSKHKPIHLKSVDLAKNFPTGSSAGGISGGTNLPTNLLQILINLIRRLFGA